MNEVVEVSSDWLALREPEDARARSRVLAQVAAGMLGSGPVVVHDLGSGTGSMMRWLAPILPGPQAWVLHDWNSRLTKRAISAGLPMDSRWDPVAVSVRTGDLAQLTASDLEGASLVTASALLDVLTSEEVHAVAEACITVGVPTLLALSVTGKVDLSPKDPLDGVLEDAFNAHQRRVSGGRRLLGQYGAAVARGLFLQAGWHVRPVDTVWRLDDLNPQLLRGWWEGWVSAAFEQSPESRHDCSDYIELRLSQLGRGMLSVVVHHTDLLAWPR